MNNRKRHSLIEAASQCGLPVETMSRFVSFHWVIPADREQHYFDEEDIARARLIHQLQEEFGVNNEAVPIILQLLDQLHCTHQELRDRLTEWLTSCGGEKAP